MASAKANSVVPPDQDAFELPKLRVSFGLEVSILRSITMAFLRLTRSVVGHTVSRCSGGLCARYRPLPSPIGLGTRSANPVAEFFDIKFCPDQPLEHNPVFAAVSKKQVSTPSQEPQASDAHRGYTQVVICRLSGGKDEPSPCETITIIRDTDVSLFAPVACYALC